MIKKNSETAVTKDDHHLSFHLYALKLLLKMLLLSKRKNAFVNSNLKSILKKVSQTSHLKSAHPQLKVTR